MPILILLKIDGQTCLEHSNVCEVKLVILSWFWTKVLNSQRKKQTELVCVTSTCFEIVVEFVNHSSIFQKLAIIASEYVLHQARWQLVRN